MKFLFSTVSAQKMQLSGSKQKIDQVINLHFLNFIYIFIYISPGIDRNGFLCNFQDEGLKKRRVVQGQDDG